MNYCQFRNDVIKRMCNNAKPLLPAGYQQVEYLASTGTQYIVTDNYANQITGLELAIKTSYTAPGSTSAHYPFGAQQSTNRFYLTATASYVHFVYSNGSIYTIDYDGKAEDELVNISLTKSGSSWTVTINSVTGTASVNPPALKLYLFRNNYQNTPDTGGYDKIYQYKCYNGDMVTNMIPCYRKSDNKPGMYDLVTNTFYTNAGSGEFSIGNPV